MIMSLADELRTANRAEFERFRAWLAAPMVDGPPGVDGRVVGTFAVTGSRTWTERLPVTYVLNHVPLAATMFHGAARGLDTLAATHWQHRGGQVVPFPVTHEQWRTIGPSAGHVRNERMLNRMPDFLLAWIDHYSPGATGAVAYARRLDIPTFVFRS